MKIFRHHEIKKIADYVKQGGVIIYPTDTVWGIGCHALNQDAVQKVKLAKGKPNDAQLIWLLPSINAVMLHCGQITPEEKRMLLKKRTSVIINGQAVRVIRSGWLNRLLTACQVPLVATSANLHGQSVITSWRQGAMVFAEQDVAVVRGRKLKQVASSLVQFDHSQVPAQIKILRPGSGISID